MPEDLVIIYKPQTRARWSGHQQQQCHFRICWKYRCPVFPPLPPADLIRKPGAFVPP